MPQINLMLFMLLNMLISSSHLIALVVVDKVSDDSERTDNRSKFFWYYHGISAFNNSILLMFDGLFLWFAFWDAYRRIYLMK